MLRIVLAVPWRGLALLFLSFSLNSSHAYDPTMMLSDLYRVMGHHPNEEKKLHLVPGKEGPRGEEVYVDRFGNEYFFSPGSGDIQKSVLVSSILSELVGMSPPRAYPAFLPEESGDGMRPGLLVEHNPGLRGRAGVEAMLAVSDRLFRMLLKASFDVLDLDIQSILDEERLELSREDKKFFIEMLLLRLERLKLAFHDNKAEFLKLYSMLNGVEAEKDSLEELGKRIDVLEPELRELLKLHGFSEASVDGFRDLEMGQRRFLRVPDHREGRGRELEKMWRLWAGLGTELDHEDVSKLLPKTFHSVPRSEVYRVMPLASNGDNQRDRIFLNRDVHPNPANSSTMVVLHPNDKESQHIERLAKKMGLHVKRVHRDQEEKGIAITMEQAKKIVSEANQKSASGKEKIERVLFVELGFEKGVEKYLRRHLGRRMQIIDHHHHLGGAISYRNHYSSLEQFALATGHRLSDREMLLARRDATGLARALDDLGVPADSWQYDHLKGLESLPMITCGAEGQCDLPPLYRFNIGKAYRLDARAFQQDLGLYHARERALGSEAPMPSMLSFGKFNLYFEGDPKVAELIDEVYARFVKELGAEGIDTAVTFGDAITESRFFKFRDVVTSKEFHRRMDAKLQRFYGPENYRVYSPDMPGYRDRRKHNGLKFFCREMAASLTPD